MKKRILILFLAATLLSSSLGLSSLSMTISENPDVIKPMASVYLSSGLDKVSGSTYNLWAEAYSGSNSSAYAFVSLYRNDGGSWVYVASASSTEMITAKASKNVTIQTGYQYRLYAYGSCGSYSDYHYKYYTF
ncbi:MAG: hypothetical protein BWY11_02458 [Firmicutes bacterium ADurb.Bin182]|nr:MAG: hypothetical protein BWY11_02458 [Firmicutes bacterium ADurb.Bin182]